MSILYSCNDRIFFELLWADVMCSVPVALFNWCCVSKFCGRRELSYWEYIAVMFD